MPPRAISADVIRQLMLEDSRTGALCAGSCAPPSVSCSSRRRRAARRVGRGINGLGSGGWSMR